MVDIINKWMKWKNSILDVNSLLDLIYAFNVFLSKEASWILRKMLYLLYSFY